VIDDESNQLGIMRPFEALKVAREKGLDLVEVSPTAQPPVCRIMDFGKFLYDKEKSERAAKKHQKVITVKEVKFRINVDEHDYETKKKHVLRFLDEGDKVKATIFFRGREMTRQSLGRGILERLVKELGDQAIVEFRPKQEGNTLHLILAPPKVQPGQKPASSGAKSDSGQKRDSGQPRREGGQPRAQQQPAAAAPAAAQPVQSAEPAPTPEPQPTGTTNT
jgi:translation initiation factor IF-3